MKIHWNKFLEKAIKEYPNEACGFLYSKKPYSQEEEWYIFPVSNRADEPEHNWQPDQGETIKLKKGAFKKGLVKIGNVHSHTLRKGDKIEDLLGASEKDLSFAKRFTDIIRIIVVCDNRFAYGLYFHDKFGNSIGIDLGPDDELFKVWKW